MKTHYRSYVISYSAKPIPIRDFDFDWSHEDYDGPGDCRYGMSGSIQEAKDAIDEMIEENGDDIVIGACVVANGQWMEIVDIHGEEFDAIDQDGGDHLIDSGDIQHVYD